MQGAPALCQSSNFLSSLSYSCEVSRTMLDKLRTGMAGRVEREVSPCIWRFSNGNAQTWQQQLLRALPGLTSSCKQQAYLLAGRGLPELV